MKISVILGVVLFCIFNGVYLVFLIRKHFASSIDCAYNHDSYRPRLLNWVIVFITINFTFLYIFRKWSFHKKVHQIKSSHLHLHKK